MTKHLFINRKKTILYTLSLATIAVLGSCDKNDGDSKTLVKEKTVQMETTQEIPSVKDRNEKGTANFKLYGDSTLSFNLSVTGLDQTDQLTVAHVHTGGPVDAGSPIIPLVDNSTLKFSGSSVSGNIKLNNTQFNAIKDGGDYYVNIHSSKFPLGLVRGQLDKTISYAQNVDLTAMSNTLRPETGQAILRMSKDSTLYYKVMVNNLTSGDVLTTSQINVGATGVNGPAIITLYSTGTDFGTAKTLKLDASQVNFLLTSQVYVSVNSQQVPSELVRGQIR